MEVIGEYNSADPDLSRVMLNAGFVWGSARGQFAAGLEGLAELGEGVDEGGFFDRDEDRKLDAFGEARLRVGSKNSHVRAAWYLLLGLRAPLHGDGLEDHFTPTIGISVLTGRPTGSGVSPPRPTQR